MRHLQVTAIYANAYEKVRPSSIRRVNGLIKRLDLKCVISAVDGQGHDDLVTIVLVGRFLCLVGHEGDWSFRRPRRLAIGPCV